MIDRLISGAGSRRADRVLGYLALALLAYLPPLFTAGGKVAADTKSYLYLDPERMMGRAASMWDPNIGFGTVTHQNIGYLFPMGPYYSLFERLGAPDWFAQRLWLGTIIFAAGLGILSLARTIGLRGPGVPVAAVAYAINPYSLHYASRISVLLLPWAALGFLIALAVKALREGGWRAPAIFALVVQVVGGVNATALIFAGVAPVAWIVWSWLGLREVDGRRALGTSLRIGSLTVVTSLWWIAGLSLQGGYGLNILRFTETVKAVARTSTPNEILRGLGYWFFYGRDRLGAWIESSEHYTQRPEIILVGYGLAALALLAACTVRWRHRGYFAGLLLLGVVFAAGAHPYDTPTPLGAVFKAFATSSTAGLALRSTGRAIPLVTLAEAMFLGVGVNAAVAWLRAREARPRVRRAAFIVPIVVIGLVFVDFPALRNGTYYGQNLLRPESIPDYWSEAIASFDTAPDAATGAQTRVLELAGSDFASYEWGNTVDPITPGLMDRPFVARELIPYGSPPSADLLNALDRRFQEGVTDDPGLVQLLGRMGIGTVVARNDIQWQRYDLARPRELERMLAAIGLDAEASFGGPLPPETEYPILDRAPAIDERTLGDPESGVRLPDRVVVYPVDGARPILRTASTDTPVVVAGDGEGLADVAGAGLLDDTGLVFYSATFAGADGPAALIGTAGDDAVLVLTDTNRRRSRRWSNVRDNVGYTETAGEEPLVEDLSDARLDVFPDASDDAFTVTEPEGVAQVRASAYGNPISYTPEDRAARALDGDTGTAWKAAAFDRAVGQYLDIELAAPITTDRVNLVQVLSGPRDRVITTARLTFLDADGNEVGERFDTDLSIVSRRKEGQTVVFGERSFARVRIEITGTNLPDGPLYGGYSAVGFGEVRLRDSATGTVVTEREIVRLPTDLLAAYGNASLDHPLVVLLRRERVAPVPPRYDPELNLLRSFELPTERTFALGGEVRLGPAVTDTSKIDLVQGLARSEGRAMNSAYMAGCVACRAYSAFDDDPATAWQSIFFGIEKAWVQIVTIEPHTYDHLDLQVIADGRHSLPTKLRILVDDTEMLVDLPPIEEQRTPNAIVTVPVDFAPLTGTRLRVQVLAAEERTATNFFSGKAVALPVAFAEIGAGVSMGEIPAQFPDECRDDLLRIDGAPVSVRIVGTNADLRAMQPLRLEACAGDVTLAAGRHVIESVRGVDTGIDVDRLVLASAAGGAAATVSGAQVTGGLGAPTTPGPALVVDESGPTSATVTVNDADEPFWLVLGQSHNPGWTARVRGGDSLGESVLVDGYANGWLVDPAGRGDLVIDLEWTPQRRVAIGIALSLAGGLLCLVLLALAWRRRRRDPVARPSAVDEPAVLGAWSWFGGHPVPLGARAFALAVLVAALGSVVIAPYVGVPMGLAVLAALRWPWARAGLRLGAAAAIGLAGLYVAAVQFRNDNPAVFEWPTLTWRARTPGWIAAVLPFVVFLVDRFTGADLTGADDTARAGTTRADTARAEADPALEPNGP